jgi:hypothetical protein
VGRGEHDEQGREDAATALDLIGARTDDPDDRVRRFDRGRPWKRSRVPEEAERSAARDPPGDQLNRTQYRQHRWAWCPTNGR